MKINNNQIDVENLSIGTGSATLPPWAKLLIASIEKRNEWETKKILKIREVEEITGKKKSSIYAAIKDGSFPAPISLGGRARGWLSTDIDAWFERRIAESRGAT